MQSHTLVEFADRTIVFLKSEEWDVGLMRTVSYLRPGPVYRSWSHTFFNPWANARPVEPTTSVLVKFFR
jgi:hypothetical protein